ncbi:MAG: SDR family oxidoreductase, partial [Candidatus Eremiobacterota bacterium]
SQALFGLRKKDYYFRFKKAPYTREQLDERLGRLKEEAQKQLKRVTPRKKPQLRVLLTGGTGFVGKEILWQAATMDEVEEMVVLIRPKTLRDRKTGKVTGVLTPTDRGRQLLEELWLTRPEHQAKFRFVEGDIEEPRLGVSNPEFERLAQSVTHVIHCAASVAFDSPYEESFAANVLGTLNALSFSHALQNAPDSPFVAHLSIETSYIHGRQRRQEAREDEIVFPRNFYNNYYELTKAMASIETERFMLDKGLRVVQLCPSIVIGDVRTGNNRGDTKVVNAPVNAFGRAKQHLKDSRGDWVEWSKAWMLFRMASVFPGDPSAELNLIPVDWVARGILSALTRPRSVGERVHLATDRRMTTERMRLVILEELGVDVKLAEPTLHRTVQLPVLTRVLKKIKQANLARALEKLGTIFGGYSEWGQPVHQVGNDAELLGMPTPRPNTESAFRMLCRHNKYVQRFGMVKDPRELARREKLWTEFIYELERDYGKPVGELESAEFRMRFYERFEPERFVEKAPAGRGS